MSRDGKTKEALTEQVKEAKSYENINLAAAVEASCRNEADLKEKSFESLKKTEGLTKEEFEKHYQRIHDVALKKVPYIDKLPKSTQLAIITTLWNRPNDLNGCTDPASFPKVLDEVRKSVEKRPLGKPECDLINKAFSVVNKAIPDHAIEPVKPHFGNNRPRTALYDTTQKRLDPLLELSVRQVQRRIQKTLENGR